MAIEKTIIINVETNTAVTSLEKLNDSMQEVGETSEKSADRYSGSIRKSNILVEKLNSLTGGLVNNFLDLADGAKKFGLATRGALAATGIGLFIVALGTVVALWDDIIDAIEDVNGKLQERIDQSIKIQESLKLEIGLIDKQIILAEKQGRANEELQKQRIASVKQLREENAEEIKSLSLQAAKIKTSALELNTREKILKTILNTVQAGSGDAFILDKQLEAANEYLAIQDLISEAKGEQLDLDIKLFDLENPEEKNGNSGVDKRDKIEGVGGFSSDKLSEDLDEEARLKQEARDNDIVAEIEKNKTIEDLTATSSRIQNETQLKWAEMTNEQKLGIASVGLGAIAQLVDKQSVAGKGISLAQTGINTAQGIMNAFATLPTPAAIAAAAAVGVAGTINSIKILKTKIPSATGRGFVSGGSGGGASTTSAPAFNLVAGTEGNQLSEDLQGVTNEPLRAVVVSGDVTTAQSVDRNIETESGI